jgi:hypothetical protein
MHRRHLQSLIAVGLLAVGGCRTTPGEPPPALFTVETDHYVGSVRTGALSVGGPDRDATPWSVELRIARTETPPAEPGTPLSASARHVFLERGDETLETRSELALGAELLPAGPLPSWLTWSQRRLAAVFPGTTVTWSTALEPAAESPLSAAWRRFDVQVSRDAERAEVALVFEGPVAPRYEDDEGVVRFGEPVVRREHVVLGSAPALDGAPQRLFLPAARPGAPDGGLLLELRLSTVGPEATESLEAAAFDALESLERSRVRARARASGLTSSETFRFESQGAVRALENVDLQRSALVFLAQQTSATLTGALALPAEEDVLAEFLTAVRGRLGDDIRVDDPVALGCARTRGARGTTGTREPHLPRRRSPGRTRARLRLARRAGRGPGRLRPVGLAGRAATGAGGGRGRERGGRRVNVARHALGAIGDGVRELLGVRWVRVILFFLVAAILVRSGLELVLARTVGRLAAERGLTCTWDDLELSLLTGRGEVRYLAIGPEGAEGESGPDLLEVEYGVFDLEVLQLFTGRLHVRRAEVDGVDARIERDPSGAWNFEQHVALAEVLSLIEPKGATKEVEEADAPRPIELKPPLAIDALRAQHARLRLVDRAVTPVVDLVMETHAGLSNLSTSARPARFSATITGNRVLDGAHVAGELTWIENGLRLSTYLQAGGLRPSELESWLALLDVRPACDSLQGGLRAEIELRVVGEERDELQARIESHDVRLATDGEESLALDALTIEIDSASARGMSVPRVRVSGVRGRASLREDGAIRVAGLDLLPAEKVESGEDWMSSLVQALELWTSASVPRWASLLVRRDPDAYAWSLGAFTIDGGEIHFTDHSVTPPASFPLFIEGVDVGTVVHDPAREAPAIPIKLALRAPGMAEVIRVEGSLGPFAPKRAIDLTFEVAGIGLEAMAGHLERAGLERDLDKGRFHLRLAGEATTTESGRTEGWIALDEVGLTEGQELFGVRNVQARGLLLDPAERLMRLGDVEITGPRLSFARDPSNELVAFGLRTLGLAPSAAMTAPSVQSGETPTDAAGEREQGPAPVRFEVGRFAWRDSDVVFVDEAADPPRRFTFDELGFELTDLTLGGDPDGPVPDPAHFTGHAVAPGVFDDMTLEGFVRSQPGAIDLTGELALHGTGLQGRLVAPYLRVLGIEPALDDGQLSVEVVASLRKNNGWDASLRLTDVALTDGGQDVWTLSELRVDDVRLGETTTVAAVTIADPFLRLAREPGGSILAGGVRLLEQPPEEVVEARPPPTLAFPVLPPVHVERLELRGARLGWTDAAFQPPIETELVVEELACLGLTTTGESAWFQAVVRIGDTVEQLSATGSLELDSQHLRLQAGVSASGIRAGPLTRMLPPGVHLDLADGRADLDATLTVSEAPDGGLTVGVEGVGLTLRDGEAEPALDLDYFRVDAPRIDPAGGVIALGPLIARGLVVEAERDAEGVLRAAGLRVESVEAEPEPEVEQAEESAPATAALPLPLPKEVALVDEALFEIERFTLRDAALGAEARPIAGKARFRLAPCVWIDEAPQELAPIEWDASGTLDGLVGAWSVDGRLAPFATEPTLTVGFEARDVRTAGLVELVPALAEQVSGTVEHGYAAGNLETTLFVRRARSTELGLSRPFGAELVLDGLTYRTEAEGEVLAGIDHVRADVERIDARRGLVHVKTIEVQRPQGVVRRNGMAVQALGLELALVPPESAQTAEVEAPAAPPPEPTAHAELPGELRIDHLLVTGIDFHVWDDAGEAPLHIAPSSLDAEVKRLTTRALSEKRPIQFSAMVEGARQNGVFEELALSGRVSLYPEPVGWASVSLGGLELPRFAGIAAEQGVDVRDGALDAGLRLRLKGSDGARVHTSLVFSDLELSELEGGPIESALGLSMPLESALFVLRNAGGEHRFSMGFSVDENGLSKSQIVSAGTQAFAGVLAGALAGAPLRLLGAMIPGGDEEETKPTRDSWRFPFAPGSTELAAGTAERLAVARRKLSAADDLIAIVRHELTTDDLARAERLANPTADECLELAQRLRQRKAELLRRRAALGTEARTFYAVGVKEARNATAELRGIERDLASIEDGLDGVLQILRSDSPRQRAKRTRSACREIADLRLAATDAVLRSDLSAVDQERIEVRSARFDPLERGGGGSVVIELRER